MIVLNGGAERQKRSRDDLLRTAIKLSKQPGAQDARAGAGFVGESITVSMLPTDVDAFILDIDELNGEAVLA